MQYSEVKMLSGKEIQLISKQSGILICRYQLKSRTMECLSDSFEQCFGVSAVLKNMPQTAIENGFCFIRYKNRDL